MKSTLLVLLCTLTVIFHQRLSGQEQRIRVRGKVYSSDSTNSFLNLFVVSQKEQRGNFGNPNGIFEISVDRDDTIVITSIGYRTERLTIPDTLTGFSCSMEVTLYPLEVQLAEFQVFAKRDLDKIYEDISELGYNPKEDYLQGVDAFASPITALYLMYSRRERKKREAYVLMEEARTRRLLKELFVQYVDYGIIDLSNEDFDDFIDYINVSPDYLKKSSQYDFIMFVKNKYELYSKVNRFDDYERY